MAAVPQPPATDRLSAARRDSHQPLEARGYDFIARDSVDLQEVTVGW